MPAETKHASQLSGLLKRSQASLQHSKAVWLLGAIVVLALAAWSRTALAATAPSAHDTALTPALRLAVGTLQLENTGQAINAASAAQLLPLWQLLAELNASSSAAPQEITAVVTEIKLNMTSAQVDAIDSMAISQDQLQAGGTSPAPVIGATSPASSVGGPILGSDMIAGGPPSGPGGSMPSPGSQRRSSTSSTSTATATPSAIQEVIQLLQSKLPSG